MRFQEDRLQLHAPARLIYCGDRQVAAQKGSVFFYHGFASSKDQQDKELYSLAEAGFLAIGIDNQGHGERKYPDFETRFAGESWGRELLAAVQMTAQELPQLVDVYLREGLIRADKIGLVGVSMGGYIAYAACLSEPRLKAVISILGSPYWWEAESDSPQNYPERFFPIALLSQNAGQDTSVPAHYAHAFHQRLAPYYQADPQRQAYYEYPDSGHFMRESDWEQCWQVSINWLKTYLGEDSLA